MTIREENASPLTSRNNVLLGWQQQRGKDTQTDAPPLRTYTKVSTSAGKISISHLFFKVVLILASCGAFSSFPHPLVQLGSGERLVLRRKIGPSADTWQWAGLPQEGLCSLGVWYLWQHRDSHYIRIHTEHRARRTICYAQDSTRNTSGKDKPWDVRD